MNAGTENRKAGLLFIILPLLLIQTAVWLNDASGPYWLGTNHDPDYVYLLNSVNTAELKKVGHIDHPGTTVQVIGAATLRVVHFFGGTGDSLKSDVLKRPEHYLKAVNAVFVAMNALMLYLLGLAAFKITREKLLSLWLQLAPFFSTTILTAGLTRVTPEPLLLFTGLLYTLLLVKYRQTGNNDSRSPQNKPEHNKPDHKTIIIFGLAAGFGMATKITFMPLLLMPLYIFPGIKRKIYYGVSALLSIVLFTLPISSQYGKFIDWVYNILTHKGGYGTGEKGVISLEKYLANIAKLLTGNPMFAIVLAISAAAVAAGLMVPGLRRRTKGNITFKLLTAVMSAQAAGLLMVGKHPANHYLLPELALSGAAVYLLYKNLVEQLLDGENNKRKRIITAVVFLAVAVIGVNPVGQVMKAAAQKNRVKERSLELNGSVEKEYPGSARIYTYGSSSLQQALKFGNDLSRNNHAEILDRADKNVYFYDMLGKHYYRYDYTQKVPLGVIRAKYGNNIIYQGPPWVKMPGVKLKPLKGKGAAEGIFRVKTIAGDDVARIVTGIKKEIPGGAAVVTPEELSGSMAVLQGDYRVHPVNYKNRTAAQLLRLSVLLDNPYYLVPSGRYYGKGAISPKKVKRLRDFASKLQQEPIDTEAQRKFTFGRLKTAVSGIPVQHPMQEVKVWYPRKKNPRKVSPTLHRFGGRGKFDLQYVTEGEGNILTVSNVESAKEGKSVIRFGYRANKKGLELEIPRGKTVHFVVSVKVPEHLVNKDNYLFIQDYDKKWNRRKQRFGGTGWLTYVVTKRVGSESTKLQFGFAFTPKAPGDNMMIREVRIVVDNTL